MSRFITPWPDFPDTPLGSVRFGEPDKDPIAFPKQPYDDENLLNAIATRQSLNENGRFSTAIFLAGAYSMSLFDSEGNQVRTEPNITGFADSAIPTISILTQTFLGSDLPNNKTMNLTEFNYVPGINAVAVYIRGVHQTSGTAYTETNANTITFNDPVDDNDDILVISTEITTNTDSPSGIVSYTHGGAGAVPTNANNIFNNIEVDVEWFGADVSLADNAAAILLAFDAVKTTGGTILVPDEYPFTTKMVFDTQSAKELVIFKGKSQRSCGFRYEGSNDTSDSAVTIGVSGVSSSGFVGLDEMIIRGQAQTIDGLQIQEGQRYNFLRNFTVRNFNGMGIYGEANDLFLNTWGDVKILNCHRAINFPGAFNAMNIANIVIENCGLLTTNTTWGATVPTVLLQGLGTTIDTLSIENCGNTIMIDIEDSITINSMYQENNHTLGFGVAGRPLVLKGSNPRVLGGNIKLGGFNALETDFYCVDLGTSLKAECKFRVNLPAANPTSYQIPVKFGTSQGAILDIDWEVLRGVNRRNQYNAWEVPQDTWFRSGTAEYIAGMPRGELARLMINDYEELGLRSRIMLASGAEQVLDGTFTNTTASSKLTRGVGSMNSKFSQSVEKNASGEFGFSFKINLAILSATDEYFITTFVSRDHTDALPRLRVLNGATDLVTSPRDVSFKGTSQISIITTLPNAVTNNVFIYPVWCNDDSGICYAHACFMVNLTQIETDTGIDFSTYDVNEIEQLITLDLIAPEARMFTSDVPDFGEFFRGDRVFKHPPVASDIEGWVATVDMADASVDNSDFVTFGVTGA